MVSSFEASHGTMALYDLSVPRSVLRFLRLERSATLGSSTSCGDNIARHAASAVAPTTCKVDDVHVRIDVSVRRNIDRLQRMETSISFLRIIVFIPTQLPLHLRRDIIAG